MLGREAKEKMSAEECIKEGDRHYSGKDVQQNHEEAVSWYRLAIQSSSDARAQYKLAECYEKGEGVEQDKPEALKWYRLAGEQGYTAAYFKLALTYKYGDKQGIEPDYVEAIKWWHLYETTSDAAWIKTTLGKFYEEGKGGIEQDCEEAVKWYRLAAIGEHEEAKNSLTNLACEKNNANAQYVMGELLSEGKVFEKNEKKAQRLFQLAAKQGFAPAQCLLGLAYLEGEWGLAQDEQEGVRLIGLAAKQGYAEAQYVLGVAYLEGKSGLVQDEQEGLRLVGLAVEKGHAMAQDLLGRAYMESKWGLVQDKQEGLRLRSLAIATGQREAAVAAERGATEKTEKLAFLTLIWSLGLSGLKDKWNNKDYQEVVDYYRLAVIGEESVVHKEIAKIALSTLASSCDAAEAHYVIGELLLKGEKFGDNKEHASDYFSKAKIQYSKVKPSEGEYGRARFRLGEIYENGYSVSKDVEEAIDLYQSAIVHGESLAEVPLARLADGGEVKAQFVLGQLYLEGKFLEKTTKKGIRYWICVAKQNEYSLELVSNLPSGDKGQAENNVIYLDKRSRKCILRGLDGNVHELELPEEISLLGLQHKLEDSNFRKAVLAFTSKEDYTEQKYGSILERLNELAEGNTLSELELADLHYHLGLFYQDKKTERSIDKAIELFFKAASHSDYEKQVLEQLIVLGSPPSKNCKAQYYLGRLYQSNTCSRLSYDEAVRWYLLAISDPKNYEKIRKQLGFLAKSKNHPGAQYVLGQLYDGSFGQADNEIVKVDKQEAAEWYYCAANQEEHSLGLMSDILRDGKIIDDLVQEGVIYLGIDEKGQGENLISVLRHFSKGIYTLEIPSIVHNNREITKSSDLKNILIDSNFKKDLLRFVVERGCIHQKYPDALRSLKNLAKQGIAYAELKMGMFYYNRFEEEVVNPREYSLGLKSNLLEDGVINASKMAQKVIYVGTNAKEEWVCVLRNFENEICELVLPEEIKKNHHLTLENLLDGLKSSSLKFDLFEFVKKEGCITLYHAARKWFECAKDKAATESLYTLKLRADILKEKKSVDDEKVAEESIYLGVNAKEEWVCVLRNSVDEVCELVLPEKIQKDLSKLQNLQNGLKKSSLKDSLFEFISSFEPDIGGATKSLYTLKLRANILKEEKSVDNKKVKEKSIYLGVNAKEEWVCVLRNLVGEVCTLMLPEEIQRDHSLTLQNLQDKLKESNLQDSLFEFISKTGHIISFTSPNKVAEECLNLLEAKSYARRFVKDISPILDQEYDKSLVFVSGLTGSGKSTLVNCLLGHSFEESQGKFYVKDKSKPFAKIGEKAFLSETRIPTLFNFNGGCLCDLPGFMDTEEELRPEHYFHLSLLLGGLAKEIASMVVVMDYFLLETMKGELFKKLIKELDQLVNDIEAYKHTVFVVNMKGGRQESHRLREKVDNLLQELKETPLLIENCDRKRVSDLLDKITSDYLIWENINQPDFREKVSEQLKKKGPIKRDYFRPMLMGASDEKDENNKLYLEYLNKYVRSELEEPLYSLENEKNQLLDRQTLILGKQDELEKQIEDKNKEISHLESRLVNLKKEYLHSESWMPQVEAGNVFKHVLGDRAKSELKTKFKKGDSITRCVVVGPNAEVIRNESNPFEFSPSKESMDPDWWTRVFDGVQKETQGSLSVDLFDEDKPEWCVEVKDTAGKIHRGTNKVTLSVRSDKFWTSVAKETVRAEFYTIGMLSKDRRNQIFRIEEQIKENETSREKARKKINSLKSTDTQQTYKTKLELIRCKEQIAANNIAVEAAKQKNQKAYHAWRSISNNLNSILFQRKHKFAFRSDVLEDGKIVSDKVQQEVIYLGVNAKEGWVCVLRNSENKVCESVLPEKIQKKLSGLLNLQDILKDSNLREPLLELTKKSAYSYQQQAKDVLNRAVGKDAGESFLYDFAPRDCVLEDGKVIDNKVEKKVIYLGINEEKEWVYVLRDLANKVCKSVLPEKIQEKLTILHAMKDSQFKALLFEFTSKKGYIPKDATLDSIDNFINVVERVYGFTDVLKPVAIHSQPTQDANLSEIADDYPDEQFEVAPLIPQKQNLPIPVDTLVFQGGGVKGIGYHAALVKLIQNDVVRLDALTRVAGTSTGAIAAMLLAAGYSEKELGNILHELDFYKLVDVESGLRDEFFKLKVLIEGRNWEELLGSNLYGLIDWFRETLKTGNIDDVKHFFKTVISSGIVGETHDALKFAASVIGYNQGNYQEIKVDLIRLKNRLEPFVSKLRRDKGIFSGEKLLFKFKEWLQKKGLSLNLTFEGLHNLALKDSQYKDLYVAAYNARRKETQIFSYETTKDVIVIDAVRCSMSIQVFFQPHHHYVMCPGAETKEKIDDEGVYYDGGSLDNYILSYFDEVRFLPQSQRDALPSFLLPRDKITNPSAIGMRLVPQDLFNQYEGKDGHNLVTANADNEIFTFLYGVVMSIASFTKQESTFRMSTSEQARTLFINTGSISAIDFDLKQKQKDFLEKNGAEGADCFIPRYRQWQLERFCVDDAVAEEEVKVEELVSLSSSSAKSSSADDSLPDLPEQAGWNCFDIAIMSELQKRPELGRTFNRDVFIAYAQGCMELETNRLLLAPEIQHAAALAVVHMNLLDDPDVNQEKVRKIAELFALVEELSQQGFNVEGLMVEQANQLLEDTGAELSNFALPKAMRTPKLQELCNNYMDAHQDRDMCSKVVFCNEMIGRREGNYLSIAELDAFFADETNRNQHKESYAFYQAARDNLFRPSEQAFLDYCSSQEVCEAYIREYYGKQGWFAFQGNSGERSTSMIDIVAKYLKVNIVIYNQISGQKLYATDMDETLCASSQPLKIMFNGYDHFVAGKLTPDQPVNQSGESQTVSSGVGGNASRLSVVGSFGEASPRSRELFELCSEAERAINECYPDGGQKRDEELSMLNQNYREKLIDKTNPLTDDQKQAKQKELKGWIETLKAESETASMPTSQVA